MFTTSSEARNSAASSSNNSTTTPPPPSSRIPILPQTYTTTVNPFAAAMAAVTPCPPGASSSQSSINLLQPSQDVEMISYNQQDEDDINNNSQNNNNQENRSISSRRRRRPRSTSGFHFVKQRQFSESFTVDPSLITWIESNTLKRLDDGRYVTLDRPSSLVRSTISISFSHNGKYFASTHGDHTVKVFEYPSGNMIVCLDGHPRTPWTVRFHPRDDSILASGCLGHECRVWDVRRGECIRKHTFRESISCVSFSPDGNLLAITSGKSLLLWNYMDNPESRRRSANSRVDVPEGSGYPRELLLSQNPFHMVDFHPSGTMLMTGEKNRFPANSGSHQHNQFTLKLVIHRFYRRNDPRLSEPVFSVPRAVAYNDAGIHFSPCGTMLAACIPMVQSPTGEMVPAPPLGTSPTGTPSMPDITANEPPKFHIAVLSMFQTEKGPPGSVLYHTPLDSDRVMALTNLKFSTTSQHLLAGFSFRPANPVLRQSGHRLDPNGLRRKHGYLSGMPPQVRVVDIYRVSPTFEMIRSLRADTAYIEGNGEENRSAEDEINVAVFAPLEGIADGVVYGTQKGRIRMFQQTTGSVSNFECYDDMDLCTSEDSKVDDDGKVDDDAKMNDNWTMSMVSMNPLPRYRSGNHGSSGGNHQDTHLRHNSV